MGISALCPLSEGRDNKNVTDATETPDPGAHGGRRTNSPRERGPFGFLAPRLAQERSHHALERDPAYIERQIGKVRAYTSYFSPEVRGIEHLPAAGPALVVGNHNAVAYMPDTWVTALAIVDRRGTEHPAYTLTYDLLLAFPLVGPFLRRIGAIPAGRGDAEAALAEGALVLDYPGGDWEACRPWTARNRIDFGGRTGFVRLALRTGVPLVPVVAHGSHDSVVVLARGDRIARALGLTVMDIKVFPILLGPLGVTTALLLPPPMPSSITIEFLSPMTWEGLGPEAADDPGTVARCAAEVTAAMQAALDRLRVERAHPVFRGFANLAARTVRAVRH
ncbi:MAG: 1-acyl-sn-glycerol-3-phosphate acyltransferase [Acidimicrobiales bacterium]|jgi:1-acyl-sn-glycerol-3-phosphate acyltransferase